MKKDVVTFMGINGKYQQALANIYGQGRGFEIGHTITQLTCQRCGHKWFPRREKPPKVCAYCNSPYWHKPRRGEGK